MSVMDLWTSAVSVKGTPGERFIRDHGVEFAPSYSVRFLPSVGFCGGVVAAPALIFPLRRIYGDDPVALEALPLAIDGRAAVRLTTELWADPGADVIGSALHVGAPGVALAIVSGFLLDALAIAEREGVSTWAVPGVEALRYVAVPTSVKSITVIAPKSPPPDVILKWRSAGIEPQWANSADYWAQAYELDGGEAA